MSQPIQQPHILLVEDSDDDAFFFRRALRQAGFTGQLTHAIDGGEAVAVLQRALAQETDAPLVPDLVFLDLKIPTLTGFEVLEWVQREGHGPRLDIAVLSGSEHAGDVDRALQLGATAYYVKPILVQQLKARFNAWHDKQAARLRGSMLNAADQVSRNER